MNADSVKASRGRPKTINRNHILDVAMQAYWEEDIGAISLNEICRKAKVSKPGLYREFGNEDGLMKAVLIAYQKKVLTPLMQMLKADRPFRETLDNMVSFVTMVDDKQEVPMGCLFVKIQESRMRLGEATQEQIDRTQEQILTVYVNWIERSKEKGEFSAEMSSQFAGAYIQAQLNYALSQMARSEKNNNVKDILTTAFSML